MCLCCAVCALGCDVTANDNPRRPQTRLTADIIAHTFDKCRRRAR